MPCSTQITHVFCQHNACVVRKAHHLSHPYNPFNHPPTHHPSQNPHHHSNPIPKPTPQASKFDVQSCSLTLWATAVLAGTHLPLFRRLFRRQVEFGLADVDPRSAQQLFQVLLLAQSEGKSRKREGRNGEGRNGEGRNGEVGDRSLMSEMPPAMRKEVFRMWQQQVKEVSSSNFQQEVCVLG